MSSKDKEGITNKLKQFFRFSKGAAGNFKTRLDFALTPEIERDLSSEAPINVRCKAIRDIGEAVLHNTLEDRAIEKLWHCTQDLLNKEQPRDIRHLALGFLRCIVQSQTSSLALLRNHFFRVVQKHDIDEDAEPRLELLQSLIDDGKYLVYVEEEVGPFLLQWFPGLVSAGLTLPLLKIIMNLIKSNASFLNEETVTGIVQNACYLCCYSPITEVVLESLRILDSVVCYAIFPQESLGSFVACLCRTVNVEGYCATSWKVMRNLLGTHMGHNALYSMCRILQDPSMRSDKCLLRGAVFHVNMGLWGSKRVPQLKCSPCSVLPSLLQALESEQAVVTYEVNFAIERLVTKYGKELSEPTWDLILDILQAIAKHITMFPLDSKDMKVHFHQTVDFAEQLLIKQEFPGSNRRLYELIENCALDRPDSSILGLMSYLSDRISPTQSMWLGALCSLMDRFYQHHPRTDIRLKALGVLRNVINKNRLAYEEDILERAVVPCLSTLHLEVDPVVRNAASHLLISLCLTCESKRCLELLDILEKILNRPFELNQSDGYVVRTEAEMTDLKTVTNGLIEIFLTKMYQLPSSHAIRVYSILIGHVELHYMRPKVFEISCCTRKPIFDCFLRVRSNASYHIGYPISINSGIIKFSPYLGIERAVTSEVGSKTVVSSPTPNFPPNTQNVTCVSIKRGCKVIITCLKSERDWTVMNKVLEELPKVLQNKAIVLTRNTNDIELLASTLCNMLMDKSLGLPETLRNTDKLMRSDFHALVLPCLSALASYHHYLDSALQQRLIRCILRVGLVTRCSKQTITALTVLTLEMREPMVKLLPEVLLDLSKMSATVNIAVPILEFLSTLTRLPKVFANFVGDQYMAVFAISLPYTNPFRYNHYTVSLAHHVIAVWFLKCRLPFRRDFVKFITTGLKANAIIPFEEGRMLNKPDFINLNEDSSNRKRSSSLTEQGSRKRERPVIAATRPVGDLRPPMDESLLSFHIELTETCVDLMARHTFSPCSALPKRLPTADWLLSNGQSATWLVGHKLITITTSGCSHSPLKHGLCDRCLTSCKSSSDVVRPEPHVDNEPRRYSSSSLQHSGSGSEVRSGSGEGPQLLANRVAPPRQNSGGEKTSGLGPTLPENRRSSNPESSIEEDSSGAKGSKQPVAQAVDHVKMVDNLLGDQGHQSQQDKVDKQFCACWCQGWAEIYVRRPTGDMSWVMRIQNQVNYDTANSEFPLNDITSLFLPSIQTGHDIYPVQHGQGETVDRLNSMSFSKSNDISELSGCQKDTLMQLNNSLITNVIASGPINIPGSPARQLSNSSSEDQDNIENQDVAFDDQDSRMRNPVRRVNSSPEMSSNWKNPFLVRDKSDGSVIPAQDSTEDDCASKKSNKGFTKDMRVSCEAIPEEISGGNTPPSHPALLTLHSDPGEGSAQPETEHPLHPSTVPSTPVSLTSADRLESNYAEPKPNRFPNRVDPAVTLNLLNPALDMRKVTSKPPQAPPTTSPRSTVREHNLDNMRQGSALKLPLPDLNENQDDSPRLRSKTISVMSPVRNSIRDNLKWPGGLMRGKETPPRSGINPSFVFLQLYHTAQFGSMSDKPIMVGSKAQTAVKLLDLIPPFETHKVGVLYVGPGQCNNETEILKNRFGSLRYAAFLRDLGTLVSLQDAPKHSLFIDLERNGQDGKFAYIWQDDVMQVTFHVATLMPNKSNDPFCNEKKKHIGNDFVSIVYNESGDEYQMQTIKGQFSYACVIVEPLELGTNRVTVRTRPELSEHIGHSDPKIISDSNVALLARQLALHVNLASMISRSLKNKGQVPYASNWLERLRKIKHLRSKLEPSSDKSNEKPEEKKPQQRVFMEDFTEYT